LVKRWRDGSLTADCATDVGINSIHAQSMQPFAYCRKFKIPFVVKSENAACRSVEVGLIASLDPGRRRNPGRDGQAVGRLLRQATDPGRTRTDNQTVMSDGIMVGFVDFAEFSLEIDRVRCVLVRSFLLMPAI